MIETKTVHSFSMLSREVEVSFTVGFCGPEHLDAILGTIRYNHVFDGSPIEVKNNTFDSLRRLGLFNDYELSYRLR